MRMTEIEFTEDTFGPDGDVQREKGSRMRVDPISAHSFVDVKKVAKRLDGSSPEPGPTPAPTKGAKARAKKPEPELESPESEPEPEPDEGDDEPS